MMPRFHRWAAWLSLVLGIFLCLPPGGYAHGLGVESVLIEELAGNRYRISYRASVDDTEALGLPVLPEDCQWEKQKGQAAASAGLTFATPGRPLTADDTIFLPWRRNGVLITAHWRNGLRGRQFFMSGGEGIVVDLSQLKAGTGTLRQTAKRYTMLGIKHILTGVDHLLFVTGLLLLIEGWKRLAFAITAFTVAHSFTLGLSVFGVIRVSTSYVEAIIALSVVFLAVEIIRSKRGQNGLAVCSPWLVSFGFGLFHGLGFAAALGDLGLPDQDIPVALLFFNVGVELGQLAVVAALLGGLWMARQLAGHRIARLPGPVALAPVYGLGIVATAWFFERVRIIFLETGGGS